MCILDSYFDNYGINKAAELGLLADSSFGCLINNAAKKKH